MGVGNDVRIPLKDNTTVDFSGRIFRVDSILCYGGDCLAYSGKWENEASAQDRTVVMKEFYPIMKGIGRSEGRLTVPSEISRQFDDLRKRFSDEKYPFTQVSEFNETSYAVTDPDSIITLSDYKRSHKISVEESAKILVTLCERLRVLHGEKRLYLNLRPETVYSQRTDDINTFIDNVNVFDFGLEFSPELNGRAGYEYHDYMNGWAPLEMVNNDRNAIGIRSDMYSVAAVLLWLITGKAVDLNNDHNKGNGEFLIANYDAEISQAPNSSIIKNILKNALHNNHNSREYNSMNLLKKAIRSIYSKNSEHEKTSAGDPNVRNDLKSNSQPENSTDSSAGKNDKNNISNKTNNNADLQFGYKTITYPDGDKYEGSVKDGQPDGEGRFSYVKDSGRALYDEQEYEGEFKNGKYDGIGKIIYLDGSEHYRFWKDGNRVNMPKHKMTDGEYMGELSDGKPDGKGIYHYSDNRIYAGNFKKGVFNGKGKLIFAGKKVYEGEFKDGKLLNGGKCTYADKNVYVGEFNGFVPNGKGTYTFHKEGTVYEGVFKDGIIQNGGKCTYKSGNFYVGEFKGWVPEGKGIYKNLQIGKVFEGIFKGGIIQSGGKVTFKNNDVYVGEFKDWTANGQGKYTSCENGTVYEGEFKNGAIQKGKYTYKSNDVYVGEFKSWLPNGKGTYTYFQSGDVYEGVFKDGRFNGEFIVTDRYGKQCKKVYDYGKLVETVPLAQKESAPPIRNDNAQIKSDKSFPTMSEISVPSDAQTETTKPEWLNKWIERRNEMKKGV